MSDALFWTAAALLSGIVAIILARTLLRRDLAGRPLVNEGGANEGGTDQGGAGEGRAGAGGTNKNRAASDLAVYRAQLDEVERDLGRGVLLPEQAEAARIEIQRRLIRTAERAEAEPPAPSGRVPRLAAWIAACAVPAVALVFYLGIGAPGMPDMRLAQRMAEAESRHAGERARFEQLTAELTERLRDRPDDVTGWTMLGRAERLLGRYEASVAAFEKALAAAGGAEAAPADLLADLGESHVYADGGRLDGEARAWFDRALARDPAHLKARHYAAVARAQSGDDEGALAILRGIEADTPADAPWLPALRQRIAQLETRIGADPAAVRPEAQARAQAPDAPSSGPSAVPSPGPFSGSVAGRGPDAESMAAAAQMSPAERDAFIRGMVGRLAERLDAAPDDPDGWVRLGRAHMVLGDRDQARGAFEKAAAIWRARLEDLPADAPERAGLNDKLRQVEALL